MLLLNKTNKKKLKIINQYPSYLIINYFLPFKFFIIIINIFYNTRPLIQ